MEEIKLNIIPNGVNPICHVSQYDKGRLIKINLFDGINPYTIQANDTFTLNIRKPDNTVITTSSRYTIFWEAGRTFLSFETSEQMTAVVGRALCELKITNGVKVIGTLNWYMDVERDVLADGIDSQSDIQDLDRLVEQAATSAALAVINTKISEQNNFNSLIYQNFLEYDEFTPDITQISGGYYNTSGEWVDNANTKSAGVIPLLPKQVLFVSTEGPTIMRTLFECDVNGNFIRAIRNGTNNRITDHILNTSNTIKYYFTSALATVDQKIRISNKFLKYAKDTKSFDNLTIINQYYKNDTSLVAINLNYTDYMTTANYAMSTPFFVKSGTKISFKGLVSASIPAIIKTNENGSTYTGVVVGDGTNKVYSYVATEDTYLIIQFYVAQGAKLYFNFSFNNNVILTDRRKAVVSFSFDDMLDDDIIFYNLFKKYGLTCGFALIGESAIDTKDSMRYLAWQNEGFDILSHSIDSNTMHNGDLTVEQAREKFKLSKQRLNDRGFIGQGWVTPSSNLGSDFMESLKDYYDFGYTSYYGEYPTAQETRPPYTDITTSPYNLYRIHLDSTLANLKLALDNCISAKGWLNLYLHAFEITDAKIEKIDEFLAYIMEKINNYDVYCLAPSKAYNYYYNVRNEDLS